MEYTKYNGWTNYATWRVNLECLDCSFDPWDYWSDYDALEPYELSERLKDNVEEFLFNDGSDNNKLVESYARAFLSDVNWVELALATLECYPQKEEV